MEIKSEVDFNKVVQSKLLVGNVSWVLARMQSFQSTSVAGAALMCCHFGALINKSKAKSLNCCKNLEQMFSSNRL